MKTRVISIILIILAVFMFTGCQTAVDDSSAVSTSIVHDNSASTWFVISTGITECITKTYEGSIVQALPGDPISNIVRTNDGTIDFGFTHSTKAVAAYDGALMFDEKHDNISGVMVFYPSPGHFVLKSDMGVISLDDFIERKVPLRLSIGIPSGNAETSFLQMLGYYGLTREDLEAWGCKLYNKGFSDTETMFADGAIDGCWIVAGPPINVIVQMGINSDIELVPFSDEFIDHMVAENGYSKYTIKGGAYEFQQEDVKSFCASSMLIASNNVSEDTVYKVTKSICENIDYMVSLHGALKNFSLDVVLDGMPIPIHPGAEKYYKEIGLMD